MKTLNITRWTYICLLVVLAVLLAACDETLPEKGPLPDEVKEGLLQAVARKHPRYDIWTLDRVSFEDGNPVDATVDEVLCFRVFLAHTDNDTGKKHATTLPVLAYRTGQVWEYDYEPGPDDWLRNACPGDFENMDERVGK